MMAPMVEAVIFDWGGVLIENPTEPMIRYIADALGVRRGAFATGVAHPLMLQFQKGYVTEDQVWERVCEDLNVPVPVVASLWKAAFQHAYRPREEMFSLASQLRQSGYKTGFLSNTEVPAMEFFHEQRYTMFDVAVFSCAEGTVKPEQQIYEIALQRLVVVARQAVFIDDRIDFIAGAEQAGLNTILFESPQQVQERLRELGVGFS